MGNPGAFSYAHTFAALVFIKGVGAARPLLHRVVAGHQQQAGREPVALRRADGGADTRSDAHRTAGDDGCESRCLPRQFPDRSAHQGPHARHRQARRAGAWSSIRAGPRPPAQFEWLGIVPDADAYLLLSLLQVMFAEGLVDGARVNRQADGVDWLRWLSQPFTPEATAARPASSLRRVRALARDLAAHAARRRLRKARHLRRPVRHTHRLPDRRGEPRRGQPRRARRQGVQHARHAGAAMANKVMGAVVRRATARKRSRIGGIRRCVGCRAGRADGQGDHDPGRPADQGDVRLCGQPGAVGAQRRRTRGRFRPAWI